MSGALPPLILYVFMVRAKASSFSLFYLSAFSVKVVVVVVEVVVVVVAEYDVTVSFYKPLMSP